MTKQAECHGVAVRPAGYGPPRAWRVVVTGSELESSFSSAQDGMSRNDNKLLRIILESHCYSRSTRFEMFTNTRSPNT